MNPGIFEFDLSVKDLAVVEVLQQVVKKSFNEGFDEIERVVKSIDIDVDAIKVPLMEITKNLHEVGENVNADLRQWQDALDAKKAEVVKSEQDFTNYEGALAEAKGNVNEDLQALTVSAARAANKGEY